MTIFKIQEWPDMPGGYSGDAIVFRSDWPEGDWERCKSWEYAWMRVAGHAQPGDTVEVLPEGRGQRSDDCAGMR